MPAGAGGLGVSPIVTAPASAASGVAASVAPASVAASTGVWGRSSALRRAEPYIVDSRRGSVEAAGAFWVHRARGRAGARHGRRSRQRAKSKRQRAKVGRDPAPTSLPLP